MPRPNVNITLGNGNLGRSNASPDSVAGLVVTGAEVAGKLELNKHYLLSSTADLSKLGITSANNRLADKEVRAFYAQAGEGAELHLIIVAAATTLTQMCDPAEGSPLRKLVDAGGGRIRLVGVNKIAPADYVADTTHGIDEDAILAAEKAQQAIETCALKVKPFRLLMPAPAFKADAENLFQPREASYNGVGFVLASDDTADHTAAIGLVLGRAAALSVHQSLGRVKSGALAVNLWLTDGQSHTEADGLADSLHDAGYIIPLSYPRKSGAYLNGDPMAAPVTDDYAQLRYGRTIDKARIITYDTYVEEILDNVESDGDGSLSSGQCVSYSSMIENAVLSQMQGEIQSFSCSISKDQNILSSETISVVCQIQPLGVLNAFNVILQFQNPALKK